MYISFIFMDPPVGMKVAMKLGCYSINCHGMEVTWDFDLGPFLIQCFAEAYRPVSDLTHRQLGSIGAGTTPGRVYKGKKMPKRKIRKLKIIITRNRLDGW